MPTDIDDSPLEKALKELTLLQRKFVEAYLINGGNGLQAALTAGYKTKSDINAGMIAYQNLQKPKVKAAMEAYWQERAMPSVEALALIANQARGIDFSKLANVFRVNKDADGKEEDVTLADIMQRVHDYGLDPYVKGVKITKAGIDIQLHDAQSALQTILNGQVFNKSIVEMQGAENTVEVNFIYGDEDPK